VQRAVARIGRPAGEPQQAEPIIEPLEQCVEPKRRNARGGELERERNTVEAAADFGDQRCVCRGQLESSIGSGHPLGKQGDSRIPCRIRVRDARIRDRQHRQSIHDLAGNTERGLARHQRPHSLRLQNQRGKRRRKRIAEALRAVQNQQQRHILNRLAQRRESIEPIRQRDPERNSDGRGDVAHVIERSE